MEGEPAEPANSAGNARASENTGPQADTSEGTLPAGAIPAAPIPPRPYSVCFDSTLTVLRQAFVKQHSSRGTHRPADWRSRRLRVCPRPAARRSAWRLAVWQFILCWFVLGTTSLLGTGSNLHGTPPHVAAAAADDHQAQSPGNKRSPPSGHAQDGSGNDRTEVKQRWNVLFIAADDLRCDLACYGHPEAQTPNLDRLADRGVLFERAYCQQAVCNPSRASLLTGLRPNTLQLWNLREHFREKLPHVVTLPQHFMNHGYFTQNIGKIFHNWVTEIKGDPQSWSVPQVMHYARHGDDHAQVDGVLPEDIAQDRKCECRDVPDDAYFDGRIAELAIEALREQSQKPQPFFLAVGFWKPHSPFNAPKKYWDLYDRQQLAPPPNPEWPKQAPRIAWHNSREILGTPARQLSHEAIMEIRHGYLAAISYLDAQVGKVIDELDRQGLTDSTVIVFWSDHGYHLGEQSLWAKTSNFELDARVPLIIAPPTCTEAGKRATGVCELVDLYPTLANLCDLPKLPKWEGQDLTPMLQDVRRQGKNFAITQHPRPAYYRQQMDAMGYSLRTHDYRFTQWVEPDSKKILATELYDHHRDPRETVNVSSQEQFASTVNRLSGELARRLDTTFLNESAD